MYDSCVLSMNTLQHVQIYVCVRARASENLHNKLTFVRTIVQTYQITNIKYVSIRLCINGIMNPIFISIEGSKG